MTDAHFSPTGPPETLLPSPPPEMAARLDGGDEPAMMAASFPSEPAAWAALGELAEETSRPAIETYAYFRVGYHRGLDQLRKNGWKGSGYVRWSHAPNRGFLRCLAGLSRQAEVIGEIDEAERCRLFLHQLDPQTYPDTNPDS